MAVNNSTILDRVWLEGTWEYQQRVPQATQQGVAAVAEFLFDPLNKMYYNQFVDTLINRIGMTRINSKLWENPWSTFKKGNLPFGSSVQDMGVKWLKAHTYEDDLDSLLEIKRPEIEPAYYTLNRRDQYTISVNYDELRNAFVDEYGLNRLINTITDVPISSDNYDEFQSMKALIAEYETRHGFYKEQITAITNEATAKDFLVKARAYAGKLKFPSVYYNIIDIPAFAEESELVLLIDPTSLAYIDVDALSAAFNIDRADIKYRIELVDEWPIPGAVALLTTEDFFQVYDVLYTTTSFYNPQNLTTNYYLTHWEILAFSPFVPAILFTTEQGTGLNTTYNYYRQLAFWMQGNYDDSLIAVSNNAVNLTGDNGIINVHINMLGNTITVTPSDVPVGPDTWSNLTELAPNSIFMQLATLTPYYNFDTGDGIEEQAWPHPLAMDISYAYYDPFTSTIKYDLNKIKQAMEDSTTATNVSSDDLTKIVMVFNYESTYINPGQKDGRPTSGSQILQGAITINLTINAQ